MARTTTKNSVVNKSSDQSVWSGIIRATGSPLKLFALIVLVCNSIFGIVAAWKYDAAVFQYTLHTFLAVVASFVLIALWSPRSFYSPSELVALHEMELKNKDGRKIMPEAKPMIPTAIIAIYVLIYAAYSLAT